MWLEKVRMDTGKHIIVIDDDEYLAEMVNQILMYEGYLVTSFQDGLVFLTKMDECKPDLILLDIKMPQISGYELLKAIRLKSSLPVIMLTGVMDLDSIAACIEQGADDYLKKPFHPQELVARIRAKLRRSMAHPG
jgi:two-component system, OmpR family, response regulator MtrA